jgi:hypothetical protein
LQEHFCIKKQVKKYGFNTDENILTPIFFEKIMELKKLDRVPKVKLYKLKYKLFILYIGIRI